MRTNKIVESSVTATLDRMSSIKNWDSLQRNSQ